MPNICTQQSSLYLNLYHTLRTYVKFKTFFIILKGQIIYIYMCYTGMSIEYSYESVL